MHQPQPTPFLPKTNRPRQWHGFVGRAGRWLAQFWLDIGYLDYAMFEARRRRGDGGFKPGQWVRRRLEQM